MSATAIDFPPVAPLTTPFPTDDETEVEFRNGERLVSSLKAIVQVKETNETIWKEVTKVTTVSRNGVGFSLSRPCTVGRLVNLILPMPVEYRAHDLNEELYNVIGIIQYCNAGKSGGERIYHIGVGLVGPQVPESFRSDPRQNYRITGMQPNGLWSITEAASQFKVRKNPRYFITLPTTIGLIHRDDAVKSEDTFTRNVSLAGASVTTSLSVRVGEKVRFACPALDFYAIAVVRNFIRDSEQTSTLHLEFDGRQFPTEYILPASGAAIR
jgi:hypothetical protein